MSINFSYTNGVSNWLHEKRRNTFHEIASKYPHECPVYDLESYGQKYDQKGKPVTQTIGTKWTYLSGFPKGLYCAMLSLVARIAAVGEPVVKGLGNIFAAPFSKKCHVMTGLKQLSIEFPKSILKLVLLTPVEVAADALVTPLAVMLDKDYALARTHFEHLLIDRSPHPLASPWDDRGSSAAGPWQQDDVDAYSTDSDELPI